MRVLVAPDSFGGTLSARQAAEAIRSGWLRAAPADEVVVRPLADGGPGFVDVLHAALGGRLHTSNVTGPLGDPVEATWLQHEGTGYVEVAQACGLHLVHGAPRPGEATSRGVGELLASVRDAGQRRAVIGLGGSATTDGGAGMLAALGAVPVDTAGVPLPAGGFALARCAGLAGSLALDDGMTLVAATDVDNPLLGPEGAAAVFGPQKGATAADVAALDAALEIFAGVLRGELGRDVRDEPGAGAAGGLGAALLALGAVRCSGAALVRELTGLDQALDGATIAITGEGSFDWQSLRGKLVTSVAAGAAERGLPCLVLAGQVAVGRREAAAAGVDAAYSVAEHAGSVETSLADPAGTLEALAVSVATQWGGR